MHQPSKERSEIGPDELIREARAGSQQALGQLLDGWRDYLLLMANQELESALQAKGGASDLVQETFLKAQQGIGRFEGQTQAEWLAWLRTILENNVANFARRYQQTEMRDVQREQRLDAVSDTSRGMAIDLAADTKTPSARVAADEQVRAVEAAMQRLPNDYRQVILLRHQCGMEFAEVGRQMDRTAEAARKLWTRAIQQLTKELNRGS